MGIQTNEIAAVTTVHIVKELPDALMLANALMKYLFTEGKKYTSGGTVIQFPIKLISNASSAWIPGTGAAINTNPSQQFQYGTLNWKYSYYSVNFSLQDFTQTMDAEEAVLDFIEEKKNGALADHVRLLSSASQGTATTDANAWNGMQDILAASGTAYAGLLDTDYTTGTYLPYISTASTVNYAAVNTLIQKMKSRIQQAGETSIYKRFMGIWNENVQANFLAASQLQQRFYEAKKLESGFEGIMINGVEFYMDTYCPGSKDGSTGDNWIEVFPVEALWLAYKYGFGTESPLDGKLQLPNTPVVSNQYYTAGNMIGNNRRTMSVGKSFVA